MWRAPGRGSRFWFILPQSKIEAARRLLIEGSDAKNRHEARPEPDLPTRNEPMNLMSLSERTALAEKLRAETGGRRGGHRGILPPPSRLAGTLRRERAEARNRDACFHMDFLAGAVESGTHALEDYARWTVRILCARGISAHFVAEWGKSSRPWGRG